jgi:hypothetical protein
LRDANADGGDGKQAGEIFFHEAAFLSKSSKVDELKKAYAPAPECRRKAPFIFG